MTCPSKACDAAPLTPYIPVLEQVSGLRRNRNLARLAIELIQETQPPVTIRQLYYLLVGRGQIPNSEGAYRRVQQLIAWLRKNGIIPYSWITDRTRSPIDVSTWDDTADFLDTVRQAYRKSLWQSQPDYLEIWLEKDALSGVFSAITQTYQVRLMVGRGFSSISFLYEAAMDLANIKKPIHIYFFGDHDPSGRNIEAKVLESLKLHGINLRHFERVAILAEDIKRYNLPPAPAKKKDPRYRSYVQRFGSVAVELDALPPDVLRERVEACIVRHINVQEWNRLAVIERAEQDALSKIVQSYCTPRTREDTSR
jgi:hypothetical protein